MQTSEKKRGEGSGKKKKAKERSGRRLAACKLPCARRRVQPVSAPVGDCDGGGVCVWVSARGVGFGVGRERERERERERKRERKRGGECEL